jgi:DNA-directed RNA polymerase specialized sigma24 family protein
MARNTINNEIRRSKKIAVLDSRRHEKFHADSNNILSQPEAEAYFQELIGALEVAKAKLTLKQRHALEISQEPDINLAKLLKELGWSRGAYQKRLKRARKKIIENLAPFFSDE